MPFVHRRRVEFVETDMAGIVHFSNFFRFMEEAEQALLRSVGLSVFQRHDGIELSFPRLTAQCEYKSPARFEQMLDIEVSLAKIGTKSVTFDFLLRAEEREVARGRIVTVCCQMNENGGWESIPIPDAIRRRLESAQ